ncbi:MAG: glycerol-3-phosphate dehydrogenase [Thermoleophilaceae bacterium]|nr:glycerol-3-phosphate dehydrogenase [Thermoleophilaceae bacterium]
MIPRADALVSLERDSFDLVVVGGGITGAGVALDAASRGYSVALMERSDFAAGTSSRSSKLIHGGLRYLQNFDLGLVREALLERSLMVKLAPHLVTPLPLLVPSFEGKRPDRLTGVGLNMYDVMAWRRGRDEDEEWSPARHRIVDGPEAVELAPALAGRDPTAAYLFYDCQTDDVRLVLTVLGEAERFGAVIVNRCDVGGLVVREGRAAGVLARDTETGREFEVAAANVVNATGVWADQLRPDELYAEEEMPRIRPSRGTHVTLSREHLPMEAGVIAPAGGGRTVFVLPWLGRTLVGTTDNDYDGSLEHVPASEEDVGYLLDAVNACFGSDIGPDDLTGAYAGVRPLISTGDPKKSVDISRRAELYETSSGLVTITGGKLTTWRRMAKSAVDRIVEREGREAPCRTHEIPLGQPEDHTALPEVPGVDESSRVHLAARYGHAARDVLRLAAAAPQLSARLSPDLPDIAAEAAFAAGHEQARSLADVLLRRTRLGLLDARRLTAPDSEGARLAARAIAGELGWDEPRMERELGDWAEVARREGLVPRGVPPSNGEVDTRETASVRAAGAAPEEAA